MQQDDENKLFEMIVGPVLYDEGCPYKLMIKKLNDIDIDYFQGSSALSDRLDDTLRIEIKHKIVNDFNEFGKQLFHDYSEKIEQKVKKDIGNWLRLQSDRKNALDILDDVFARIHSFTRKQLNYVPSPTYSSAELRELYNAAMKVSLVERIAGTNDKDVIRYYHALINHTVWTCRMLTRRRFSQLLMSLVDKLSRVFDMQSQWSTHFNDAPSLDRLYQASLEYNPHPLDFSNIQLPDTLLQLAERMAENVHDVWAATRLSQGWSYGPERDDALKKHPCLIPYNLLPEEEKLYDRNTSIQTLKFILANNFTITSNPSQ